MSASEWLLAIALWLPVLSASGQTPVHLPPASLVCSNDRVVWVNTRSGVYHYRGERYFGSTKAGKFICEKEAKIEGDRATRNGQ